MEDDASTRSFEGGNINGSEFTDVAAVEALDVGDERCDAYENDEEREERGLEIGESADELELRAKLKGGLNAPDGRALRLAEEGAEVVRGGNEAGEMVKKCVASISLSSDEASVGSVGKSLGRILG